MFKHISLASSSAGNCHLVSQDGGETYIMLDAGLTLNQLNKKLFKLRINLDQIKAVLITHEHGDHFKGVKELINLMPIYATKGTLGKYVEDYNAKVIVKNKLFEVNNFRFIPFEVKHNAAEPVSFIIRNDISEFMIYLTDTGQVDFSLNDLRPSLIIIEANYSEEVVKNKLEDEDEEENAYLKLHIQRNIMMDNGHLSLKKTIKILKDLKLGLCKQIVLCHLSESNSESNFAKIVQDEFNIPTKQLRAREIETTSINEQEHCGF